MNRSFPFNQALLPLAIMLTVPSLASAAALEEIVVVAQKKAEQVQDVPITISAFSANGLQGAGIKSSDELSVVTPGLQFGRAIGSATPFIRGVGSNNTSAGDESNIASYVDGVYYASMIAGVQNFNNLERVEVLKGPQGTLFGRNATGGLIHYITKDPQFETEANVKVGYGNYDTSSLSLYATTGISDTIAADIALYYEDQGEGYGENLNTGRDVNQSETTSARTKWLFTPSDDTRATLALDYSENRSSIGAAFTAAPGALAADGSGFVGDWWDTSSDYEPLVTSFAWGGSLKIEHDFDEISLVSITAYRDNNERQQVDQDGTVVQLVDADLRQYTETISQEFNLSGEADQLDWIAGVYLFNSESGYQPINITGLGLLFAPGSFFGTREITAQQDTTSYAVFGQTTYTFNDRLNVTLGLRYSYDKRELSGDELFYAGLDSTGGVVAQLVHDKEEDWSELTWRLSLDYTVNDNTLAYVSLSRGFKSGVYNLTSPSDDAVDPETLDALELGVKTDLLDGTLRWNTSLFYYQYDNLQLQRLDGGLVKLLNAAEAITYGVETSLDYAVTDNLTLMSSLSLLKTEYDAFDNAPISTPTGVAANAVVAGDASGNDLTRAPAFSGNIGAIYTVEGDFGGIETSAFYYYNDGFYWEADNRFEQESYSTINATVTWYVPGDQWQVQVFGRNLGDEEYSYYASGGQLGDLYTAAPPRTFGVSVQCNF